VDTEGPRGGLIPGILRFFVVPLVLVGVSVALFAGLGALVGQGPPSTHDLLLRISEGGKNARWQAAMELSNRVYQGEVDLARDERLVLSIAEAFRRARVEGDDPRILRYLSRFLARSPLPAVAPVLEEAVGDGSPDVRMFAAEALAERGDPAALAVLLPRLSDTDAGVRTIAAWAVPLLASKGGADAAVAVRPALLRALGDDAVDVRWNAALGLARLGAPGGEDQVWQMLHRESVRALVEAGATGGGGILSVEGADPATPAQLEERVVANAVSAVYLLRDRSMLDGVRRLAEADPSDRVRDFALKTVAALEEEVARRGPLPQRAPCRAPGGPEAAAVDVTGGRE